MKPWARRPDNEREAAEKAALASSASSSAKTTSSGPGHSPNPVGFAIVLLGALGTVIALFLPRVESRTFGGIANNTLVGSSWLLVIPAVGVAALAYGVYRGESRRPIWLLVGAAVILYAGLSGVLSEDARTLYPVGRSGNVISTAPGEVADPGAGLYLLSVSGGLVFLGGLLLVFNWTPYGSGRDVRGRARKKCPECAEMIQADANVCRFCSHRFAR